MAYPQREEELRSEILYRVRLLNRLKNRDMVQTDQDVRTYQENLKQLAVLWYLLRKERPEEAFLPEIAG